MRKTIVSAVLAAIVGCDSTDPGELPKEIARTESGTIYRVKVGSNDYRYYGVDQNGNGFPLSK